jgi:hypothetical protein
MAGGFVRETSTGVEVREHTGPRKLLHPSAVPLELAGRLSHR